MGVAGEREAMSGFCKHCRQDESEHHDFEAIKTPEGCVCDPWTWEPSPVLPICAKYKGNGHQNCEECEHDMDCHGGGKP